MEIKFKHIGKNTIISSKASFYNPENISIGDNVRIDDFCILSVSDGFIEIGNNIHISAYSALYGAGGIVVMDDVFISGRCSIYSITDTPDSRFVGSQFPENIRNIKKQKIVLEKSSGMFAGSFLFPGAYLSEGSVLAANSFTDKKLSPWTIYGGNPAVKIRERNVYDLPRNSCL